MPEFYFPSLSGFAFRPSEESESQVEMGLVINTSDNYPLDLKSNLINNILDDFVYPYIISQSTESKISVDFKLQMAQVVMYDDDSKNKILLNHEVDFYGNVYLTNQKEYKEGCEIAYSDLQDVLGLYPSVNSDLNSANIMLVRLNGKWLIAGDFIYNKAHCKKIIAESQKRLLEVRLDLDAKRVNEFLRKLHETIMYFLVSYLLARRNIVFNERIDATAIFKDYKSRDNKSMLGNKLVSLSDEILQLKENVTKDVIDSTYESNLENLLNMITDIVNSELKLYNYFDTSQRSQGHFIRFGGVEANSIQFNKYNLNSSENDDNHEKNKSQTKELLIPLSRKDSSITPHWDAFISHASEDKDDFVRPLANKLVSMGLTIWYDEFTLQIGDRLSQKIEEGLLLSDFGIVVLSKYFFKKKWPKSELSALNTKSIEMGRTVILPVWHEITKEEIAENSPMLVDTVAVLSHNGIDFVAERLASQIKGRLTSSVEIVDVNGSNTESDIHDNSDISDEDIKTILLEFDTNTPKLKRESSVKRFEKYSRDKSFLYRERIWEIIYKLILSKNYEFIVYGLIAVRNLINNNDGKLQLISRNLSQLFDQLENLELLHLDNRIKDDVFFIIQSLYDIENFSEYCRRRILFAIHNIEDNKYDIFMSKYLQFFINHKEYFPLLKDDLEQLMQNDDKSGKRAQAIYEELM